MRLRNRHLASFLCALAVAAAPTVAFRAQQVPIPDSETTPATPHRTRLILKDGSYQIVMSYQIKGKIVSYLSAERGSTEEIPFDLIDWDATHTWERQHTAPDEVGPSQAPPPAIDPELLKEEADRASLTPEVAPDLHLPELDSVLALDYFHGAPELVPLVQSEGELNHTTSHNILKLAINPHAASHEIVQLKGIQAAVQMHVASPVIYLRIGDDAVISHGGTPFVVDTQGSGPAAPAGKEPSGGSANSGYVMVRADVRTDTRVLASFNIASLGSGVRQQEDVIETNSEALPGGHWMKITPRQPLDFGEYALMEIVSEKEVNLSVWDFGVHPTAPENRDVLKPKPKRPITLERRTPDQ
jgi:hypothetical protein